MLTTITGRPWKAGNFKKEWRKATLAAGLSDLHFHDLRGPAITLLADHGCTVPEIASITGHSFAYVNTILSKYLARNHGLAIAAMKRLENAEGTVLQTASDRFAIGYVDKSGSAGQDVDSIEKIETARKR
jgi:integrase